MEANIFDFLFASWDDETLLNGGLHFKRNEFVTMGRLFLVVLVRHYFSLYKIVSNKDRGKYN